jgi:cyclin-dependent kinase 2
MFPGICEVDQLFQIFSRLGTPNEKTWKGFEDLPNYSFTFPNWKKRSLAAQFPNLEPAGVDLLGRLLNVDPSRRITAAEALKHRYFDSIRQDEPGMVSGAGVATR